MDILNLYKLIYKPNKDGKLMLCPLATKYLKKS